MDDFKCPNCNFNSHVEGAIYCQECGTYLFNHCSYDDCEFNDDDLDIPVCLDHNAKFCNNCGSETTFKLKGFFNK